MILEKIWIYLGPLVGVTLGWLFNEMSFWFRSKREDKKKLKEVLYNLMEVYYTLYTGNLEPLVEICSKKIAEKFSIQKEEDKKVLEKIFKPFLNDIGRQIIIPADKLKEVKEKYEKAANSLASTEPLLAFQVSGRTDIFEIMNKYENDAIPLAIKYFGDLDTNDLDSSKTQLMKVKNFLLDEVYDSLENDINTVAWKINLIVWYRTKKAIKFIKKNRIKKMEESMEEMFASMPEVGLKD